MTTSIDAVSAAPLADAGRRRVPAPRRRRGHGSRDARTRPRCSAAPATPRPSRPALLPGFGEVVLKLGAEGAEWRRPGRRARARAGRGRRAGPVVDTTGAGDAFAAGWLAARREGREPAAALARACAVAATAVTRRGRP